MRRHSILTCMLMVYSGFFCTVVAQDVVASLVAVIQIDTLSDNMLSIKSICDNRGEEPYESLVYEVLILKRDSRGNVSNNKQGGEFSIDPKSKELLSTQRLNFGPDGLLTVRLKIFQGAKMLADAFYTNGNVEQADIIQKDENPDQSQSEVDPLLDGGLIIDETRTRLGRDFYDHFYTGWQTEAPPGIGDYFIRIEEQPFRGLSTVIKVYLDDTVIFQQILQPRANYIEDLVGFVVSRMQRAVKQLAELRKDFSEEGDQSGTGIY